MPLTAEEMVRCRKIAGLPLRLCDVDGQRLEAVARSYESRFRWVVDRFQSTGLKITPFGELAGVEDPVTGDLREPEPEDLARFEKVKTEFNREIDGLFVEMAAEMGLDFSDLSLADQREIALRMFPHIFPEFTC